MPASNDSMASSGPSSTRAVDTSVAAPTSGTSNMTPVIIGVSVGVGCCVLLILGYRIWKCTGRSAVPLPPKGPLAHHRQRQMLSVYPQSKVPMYTGGFALFTNNAPYGDHTPHTSYQTDDSSISPSFSSPITSQASLIPTSEENGEITRKHRPSFGSTASPVRHPLHDHRKRTLSNAGSVHSSRSRQSSTNGTVRGAPHARHSRVDIVLPEPLAPGLYNNNTSPRQSRMRVPHSSRASSRERPFEARGEGDFC